jgi:hypothetical protein
MVLNVAHTPPGGDGSVAPLKPLPM